MIFGTLVIDVLILLGTFFFLLVLWMRRKYNYWSDKGVEALPIEFPFGTVKKFLLQSEAVSSIVKHNYDYLKSKTQRHAGGYLFVKPEYLPFDPEIIKKIMQTDFQYFNDRGMFYNEEDDPLTAHLFALGGKKWKKLRTKLTPTFTSGKMKMMLETLVVCADELVNTIDSTLGEPLDIKEILARFTTDIIGSCAFGIECNSLKEPDNEFRLRGKTVFDTSFFENIKNFTGFVFPGLIKHLHITFLNKELTNFFMNVVKDTVRYREENNIHRKDFMHLMIQLKNRGRLVDDGSVKAKDGEEIGEEKITINELAAQCFVFFLAGFETSSTTMTFCLYELTQNQDIQANVRQEINEVLKRHNGKITYEALQEMHYMEKVIQETLRKYPPLPQLSRKCTQDWKVPDSNVVIEKGTLVVIPIYGLHFDKEYYPDPEKFDPERFTEENKKSRHPYTYLPFGEGPRVCIGLRFGMMQTKVGLTVLLKNYQIELNKKTKTPLIMDPRSFIMSTKGGVWLTLKKIK